MLTVFFVVLFLGYLLIILISLIPYITKPVVIFFFVANAIVLYFIDTYNIIIDKTMMGHVLNTDPEEAVNLYSNKIISYVVILGLLPSIFIAKIEIVRNFSFKKTAIFILTPLLLLAPFLYINSKTWLWLDKNLRILGALSMPFCYTVNAARYQIPRWTVNQKEYPLPPGEFMHDNNVIVVLVIGEAARSANFSLFGYERQTNPRLENINNIIPFFNATSCATYTTAGIRCILSHLGSKSSFVGRNYEYLPSYLKRNDVKTIWRSNNFGEPDINVHLYQKRSDIRSLCPDGDCLDNSLDSILLCNLKNMIQENLENNLFIVLHQSGSHGPAYYRKYPLEFEQFSPVCKSVELRNCSQQDLINAYDNTILYTDYFLSRIIDILKEFHGTPAVMLYISDHGQSLGENNIYLHGMPNFLAPDVQRQIPFIAWLSDEFIALYDIDVKSLAMDPSYSQDNIFHSVMGAFGLRSSFYNEILDIFKPNPTCERAGNRK